MSPAIKAPAIGATQNSATTQHFADLGRIVQQPFAILLVGGETATQVGMAR